MHRSAGDVDKAIVCYEEALQILHKCASGDGMKSHDIYFNLGNLYDGTNSNEKAMESYVSFDQSDLLMQNLCLVKNCQ